MSALSDEELERLEACCRTVPLTRSEYVASDFVTALFDTVLDYQNPVVTLRKAGDHFRATARCATRTRRSSRSAPSSRRSRGGS
jgi:hypothetical protein